jgi:curved DNA-binding protein CbpA
LSDLVLWLMEEQDFYGDLGISEDASIADIKKAYRTIAVENHPDKTRNDAPSTREIKKAKFDRATKAYDILSHEESRANYDKLGLAMSNEEREHQCHVQLAGAIQACLNAPNPVSAAARAIAIKKNEAGMAIVGAERRLDQLRQAKEKMTYVGSGPPIVLDSLDGCIREQIKQIKGHRMSQLLLDDMARKVQEYSYKEDPPPTAGGSFYYNIPTMGG